MQGGIEQEAAPAAPGKINISSEVQNDIKNLEAINQKQEERIHNIEAKALQLTNLYFVFQGVILSSISSASPAKCHNWLIPFFLSLVAALLNLVALFGTVTLFLRYSEELDQNYEDLRVMRVRRLTRAQIEEVDPGSPLLGVVEDGMKPVFRQNPDAYKKLMRRVYSFAGIGFFLGFSVVILYGCRALLCDNKKET
ncbi:hypothetical protein I3760_12G084900 [Carya illinoinensis]|nr:hypothetical protein I3760_12G084900 [Carya illinoinensis]